MDNQGKLYICPTPIGNLEDITLRTLNTLREVDLIAAEDTRHTIKLLNHYEIKKPLISYHQHNEKSRSEDLLKKLKEGKNIALVSDAGMPGISDPGEELIKQAIDENFQVIALPGATASITGLVISGLSTKKFAFEGFLSSKKSERRKELENLKGTKYTTIIYESPYRVKDTLEDILKILGDIEISVSRELTKKYEETLRGKVSEVLTLLTKDKLRGEFLIVLKPEGEKIEKEITEEEIILELETLINRGISKSQATKKVSQKYGIPRNQVYALSIKL